MMRQQHRSSSSIGWVGRGVWGGGRSMPLCEKDPNTTDLCGAPLLDCPIQEGPVSSAARSVSITWSLQTAGAVHTKRSRGTAHDWRW